jgi:hypothetical protein
MLNLFFYDNRQLIEDTHTGFFGKESLKPL